MSSDPSHAHQGCAPLSRAAPFAYAGRPFGAQSTLDHNRAAATRRVATILCEPRGPQGDARIMRRSLPLAALVGAALAVLVLPALWADAPEKEAKTIKLFNGTDLKGWKTFLEPKAKDAKPEDVWSVKDGEIH